MHVYTVTPEDVARPITEQGLVIQKSKTVSVLFIYRVSYAHDRCAAPPSAKDGVTLASDAPCGSIARSDT